MKVDTGLLKKKNVSIKVVAPEIKRDMKLKGTDHLFEI